MTVSFHVEPKAKLITKKDGPFFHCNKPLFRSTIWPLKKGSDVSKYLQLAYSALECDEWWYTFLTINFWQISVQWMVINFWLNYISEVWARTQYILLRPTIRPYYYNMVYKSCWAFCNPPGWRLQPMCRFCVLVSPPLRPPYLEALWQVARDNIQ